MLRHSRFKSNLPLSQKRINFDRALQSAKSYDDWKQIILSILTNQKGITQFELLSHYLGMMDNINYEYLDKVCFYIDSYLNQADSLSSILVLMKYILKYSTNGTLIKCERQFKSSIKKYGFLEKQSQILQQGINQKNKHYLPYFQLGIQILPIIYTRCRILLPQSTINIMLKCLCIIPSQSIEIIMSIGKLCDWIINTRSNKDLNQQLKIQSTAQILLNILDCYQKNYAHKTNLIFLFQAIDQTLLYRAIKKNAYKFLQKRFNMYINLWTTLLQQGGSSRLIKFIYEISNLYKNSQQYDLLVQIYQRLIQPVIFKRIKFSRTAQQQVQQLSSFYVDNLFTNIPNKIQSIQTILDDYNRLDSDYKEYWASIIYKIIKSAQNRQQIQQKYGQFIQKQGVKKINNEDFLNLKENQIKIKKHTIVNNNSGSKNLQKYRQPSINYSIIPFNVNQVKGKRYNFILNIQTGINILYNITKLANFINKISFIIQKSPKKILTAVLLIFYKMQQNKMAQIQDLVQKILFIPNDETHLASVQNFIKYVLDNINTLLQYQDQKLNEFSELFKIEASFSPCPVCVNYDGDTMINMNYLQLPYGKQVEQQLKIYRNCLKCRKHYLSTGNILILPDIMFVLYDPNQDKRLKYFRLSQKYQQHTLKLIQLSVNKNQTTQNHIFWRQSNPKIWLYSDSQCTKQIQTQNIQQVIQKELDQNALPVVVIYSR